MTSGVALGRIQQVGVSRIAVGGPLMGGQSRFAIGLSAALREGTRYCVVRCPDGHAAVLSKDCRTCHSA